MARSVSDTRVEAADVKLQVAMHKARNCASNSGSKFARAWICCPCDTVFDNTTTSGAPRERKMGKKRQGPAAASSSAASPKKQRGITIPDVTETGNLASGGSPRAKPIFDDRIHIGLSEYAKNGSGYSQTFGEGILWQAQMATSRQPSPLDHMRKQVKLYGEEEAGADDPPPTWMEGVEMRYRAVYQVVGKRTDDTDDIGWAKHRLVADLNAIQRR